MKQGKQFKISGSIKDSAKGMPSSPKKSPNVSDGPGKGGKSFSVSKVKGSAEDETTKSTISLKSTEGQKAITHKGKSK